MCVCCLVLYNYPYTLHTFTQENSWRRVCCHKGLVANLFFLLVMMLGIVLGEVLYPLEGVRGNGVTIANDTACLSNTGGGCLMRSKVNQRGGWK